MLLNRQKIELFDLCADLLLYPKDSWYPKLSNLKEICKNLEIPDIPLDEIRAVYINFFEINASKYKTVPMASFWLDGKMMGQSCEAIETFYKMCGFEFKGFGTADHISNMLAFCAILIENNRLKELKEFVKWLDWIDQFSQSVNRYPPIQIFSHIIEICKFELERIKNAASFVN